MLKITILTSVTSSLQQCWSWLPHESRLHQQWTM